MKQYRVKTYSPVSKLCGKAGVFAKQATKAVMVFDTIAEAEAYASKLNRDADHDQSVEDEHSYISSFSSGVHAR